MWCSVRCGAVPDRQTDRVPTARVLTARVETDRVQTDSAPTGRLQAVLCLDSVCQLQPTSQDLSLWTLSVWTLSVWTLSVWTLSAWTSSVWTLFVWILPSWTLSVWTVFFELENEIACVTFNDSRDTMVYDADDYDTWHDGWTTMWTGGGLQQIYLSKDVLFCVINDIILNYCFW